MNSSGVQGAVQGIHHRSSEENIAKMSIYLSNESKIMQVNPQQCRKLFRLILTVLISANRVKRSDCGAILELFSNFLDRILEVLMFHCT